MEIQIGIQDRSHTCPTSSVVVDIRIINRLNAPATTAPPLDSVCAAAWDAATRRYFIVDCSAGELLVLDPFALVAESLTTLEGASGSARLVASSEWLYAAVQTPLGPRLRRLDKQGETESELELDHEDVGELQLAHAGNRLLVAYADDTPASYAEDGQPLALVELPHSGLSQLTSDDVRFAFVTAGEVHLVAPGELSSALDPGCISDGTVLSFAGGRLHWFEDDQLWAATIFETCQTETSMELPEIAAPLTGTIGQRVIVVSDVATGEVRLLDAELGDVGMNLVLNRALHPEAFVMAPGLALLVQAFGEPTLIQL